MNKLVCFILLCACYACSENRKPAKSESTHTDSLMRSTVQKLDLKRSLFVADSLEDAEAISTAQADFMRGRAYDEGWQMTLAEHYYRKAFEGCTEPIKDWALYAESGYRLAAILFMRLDIEESLRLSTELVTVAEKEPEFPIVFKAFLISNIAYCQQNLQRYDESIRIYHLAYNTLKEEAGKVSDRQYQSDMYHMTLDIADNFYTIGNYEEAFSWIQRCEQHSKLYAQFQDARHAEENSAHVALRKAVIMNVLGKVKEAEDLYQTIDLSKIKDPPGITWQGRYLMATGRNAEAADCYARLDTTYVANDGAKATFDYIQERLLPRYQANLKAGRMEEALELSSTISSALDSAIIYSKKSRATEMSVFYQTEEKEMQLKEMAFTKRMYLFALMAAVSILLFIIWLVVRMYRLNKRLEERNRKLYEEIQLIQEKTEQSTKQLEKSPKEELTPNQRLYLQICKVMEDQHLYAQPDMNREKLAAVLGTNYKYIANAVRECTANQTVNQFINSYRIRRAAMLLAQSDRSITDIMDMTGFNHRSHFNKVFREYYELTPNEYRKAANDRKQAQAEQE